MELSEQGDEGGYGCKHRVWGQHFGTGVTVRGRLCNGTEIKMRTQEETGVVWEGKQQEENHRREGWGKSLFCTLGWSLWFLRLQLDAACPVWWEGNKTIPPPVICYSPNARYSPGAKLRQQTELCRCCTSASVQKPWCETTHFSLKCCQVCSKCLSLHWSGWGTSMQFVQAALWWWNNLQEDATSILLAVGPRVDASIFTCLYTLVLLSLCCRYVSVSAILVHVKFSPSFPLAVIWVPPMEEVCWFAFRSLSPGNDFDL